MAPDTDKKDKFLRTYLNDHLAGAEAGLQLARDCRAHNPSGALGGFLAELIEDIEHDRNVLRDLYSRVHSTENVLKKTTTWLASKMGRLKLENVLLQYSNLTRLEELEALVLGIRGKLALWDALQEACGTDPRFEDVDFEALRTRAARQVEAAEKHRLNAAKKAFARADRHPWKAT